MPSPRQGAALAPASRLTGLGRDSLLSAPQLRASEGAALTPGTGGEARAGGAAWAQAAEGRFCLRGPVRGHTAGSARTHGDTGERGCWGGLRLLSRVTLRAWSNACSWDRKTGRPRLGSGPRRGARPGRWEASRRRGLPGAAFESVWPWGGSLVLTCVQAGAVLGPPGRSSSCRRVRFPWLWRWGGRVAHWPVPAATRRPAPGAGRALPLRCPPRRPPLGRPGPLVPAGRVSASLPGTDPCHQLCDGFSFPSLNW